MTMVYRLKVATLLLGVVTAITSTLVWGESTGPKKIGGGLNPGGVKIGENFDSASRFAKQPLLTYETQQGDTLFALQVQPKLPEVPARPRDILIMVDTSASQAGKYLAAGREIVRQIVQDAAPNDRISLWVVNIPKATRNLTKGLFDAKSPRVAGAVESLKNEYASGAVDLKAGIERAIDDFDKLQSRQQILLYVGDGESAFAPLTEKDRHELGGKLRSAHVQFFAVPLGTKINAHNIHGIAGATGGTVVRIEETDPKQPAKAISAMVTRLNKAIATPVFMPGDIKFNAAVSEMYPTKLPPLRADTPVLVIGRFEKGQAPKELTASIKGKIVGKDLDVSVHESMPVPGVENFFLNTMLTQWKDSPLKDAQALLRADRTLALAYEQGRLAREEYLTQAQWALGANQLDAAKNLFDAARSIDPNNAEVKAGVAIVDKLKKGVLTLEQIKAAAGPNVGIRYEKQPDGQMVAVRMNLVELAQDQPAPKDPPAPNANPQDLLRAEQARRAVEEQKVRLVVEQSLALSRDDLRRGDPKTAKDRLIAQRDSLKGNPDISEALRTRLGNQIELLLTEIGQRGELILRRKAEENEAIARARAKILNVESDETREKRIQERVRNFTALMNQARFEDAYREALVMGQEFVNRGEAYPVETFAVYQMGQAATNLREMRELTRIREDRFLLTMMQVEKSHIPYPDEPSVHFPPSRVWQELTERRKPYGRIRLGERRLSEREKKRLKFLESSLSTPVPQIEAQEFPLVLLLSSLEDFASPPGSQNDPSRRVKILVDEKAFKAETNGMFDLERTQVKFSTKLVGVSLGTALRLICEQIDGTYWVTPDAIEIVPAGMAIREKVIDVFAVEDLVIPIPNSINQQALSQSLTVLGATFSLGGGFTGVPIQGAFGGVGGGFQFFGGGVGGGNFQNQGQGANNIGQLFQGAQGQVNLGAGGGFAGFGGGQLGQFGNLGGQFGFQGGTQDALLITMINEVVARGEWSNAPALLGGMGNIGNGGGVGGDLGMGGMEGGILQPDQLNSLGYYPPARALVVRGTSRIHTSRSFKLKLKAPEPINFNRPVAQADKVNPGNPGNPAQIVKKDPPKHTPPLDTNPEKLYQEVLAKGQTDPGEIIACLDFMASCREFKHAAELLKASLRTGLTAEPWAQEALALALEGSQGSTEEIERARVSAVDLEPQSPLAYLKVSKSLAELGDLDRAIRFCREAARLEPNMPEPYVNALVFAGDAKDRTDIASDVWAAKNLLARDWTTDSQEYHLRAREHLKNLEIKLAAQQKMAEVQQIREVLDADKRRDLVIEMKWSGQADLDMKVKEAIGTTCSSIYRQTTGGGVLLSEDFTQKTENRNETYVAAQAFNGNYQISVDRVWGRPLGNKVHFKVIKHQGTPDEQVEVHTLDLNKETTLSITLDKGRRVSLASVPLPGFSVDTPKKPTQERDTIDRLRAITQTSSGPMVGMSGGIGTATNAASSQLMSGQEKLLQDINIHTSVASRVPNGLELRQQTIVTKDGKMVLRMAPVFETAGNAKQGKVKLDVIPGSES